MQSLVPSTFSEEDDSIELQIGRAGSDVPHVQSLVEKGVGFYPLPATDRARFDFEGRPLFGVLRLESQFCPEGILVSCLRRAATR